jgi:NAD(P)-dependent dehydrogenase (short-subunit alcohol dehydrogenase family)
MSNNAYCPAPFFAGRAALMDVTNLAGKWALVTGAASGIGRETALALARRGANLIVCDVDEDGLRAIERDIRSLGREVLARRVDVASREEMASFAAAVHEEVEAVDILMNNAGVALGARFLDTTLEDWDWIVGINFWGVVHGCHYFLPPMVRRGRGHVINVASAAGYAGSQALSAYCTTKFAVLGLSESLRDELLPLGIGVTTVCPGLINTPITQSSRLRGPQATPLARRRMVELYERRNYGPERVATKILQAVQRNRGVAPIAPEAWLLYYLKRFTPGLFGRFQRLMARRMQREWTRPDT